LDAARGLSYLHSKTPAIVHFGFHTNDILIDDTGRGILGGFGWASVCFNLSVKTGHVFIATDDIAGDQRQPQLVSHRVLKRVISIPCMWYSLSLRHI
jgi:hypothetical protein